MRACLVVAAFLVAWAGGQADDKAVVAPDSKLAADGRYGVFMFPPPGMCFPDNSAVYVATALADGLFTDDRVRRLGIRLRLRLNGHDLASVAWDPGSGEEADEGLAHHFSIPGLPDGGYDAELAILLGDDGLAGSGKVGHAAESHFQVDHAGKCLPGPAHAHAHAPAVGSAGTEGEGTRAGGGGQDARGGGAQERRLVNVALGKPAWMSTVAEGSDAGYACDGLTMVSSRVERNALSRPPQDPTSYMGGGLGERGRRSGAQDDVWWEVDLQRVYDLHIVDVWAAKEAGARGSYPPIVALQESLKPFTVTLLAPDWSQLAQCLFASNTTLNPAGGANSPAGAAGGGREGGAGGGGEGGGGGGGACAGQAVEGEGIFSWYLAGAGGIGVSARYVRVSLVPLDDDGPERWERSRQLGLLEVGVFARKEWNCTSDCEDLQRGRCPQSQPLRTTGACECAADRVGHDCSGLTPHTAHYSPPC